MKRIIFGAGLTARNYYGSLSVEQKTEILCFADNAPEKQYTKFLGLPVIVPQEILKMQYDLIVIPNVNADEIVKQLIELGIDQSCIETAEPHAYKVRNDWLKDFAEIIYKRNILGDVAEAGVYRGAFAKKINEYFYDRTLYLFDTFEGFLQDDIREEKLPLTGDVVRQGYFGDTSVDIVMRQMPFPEKCVIHKGQFPYTAEGITVFVCLDMDLYKPLYLGLHFFWDKMVSGGVILLHDYYSKNFTNAKEALHDFERNIGGNFPIIPIGDSRSMLLVKP